MRISIMYQKACFHFLKILSCSIGGLLGIFFGCDIGPQPAEYGMPHADYQISGTILSADNNAPIKGISITIRDTLVASESLASTQTDSLGKYTLQITGFPEDHTWRLAARDIDSTENGSFAPRDTVISIPASDLQNPDGTWYKGRAEKTVDIKIDRDN